MGLQAGWLLKDFFDRWSVAGFFSEVTLLREHFLSVVFQDPSRGRWRGPRKWFRWVLKNTNVTITHIEVVLIAGFCDSIVEGSRISECMVYYTEPCTFTNLSLMMKYQGKHKHVFSSKPCFVLHEYIYIEMHIYLYSLPKDQLVSQLSCQIKMLAVIIYANVRWSINM